MIDSPSHLDKELAKRLAEPYAFALATWPAIVGLTSAWPDGLWTTYGRTVIWIWLGAMQLAAYGGGRGAGFGNATLLASGIVAVACMNFPSPWILLCMPALLVTLLAAQRLRLGAGPPCRQPPT